MRKTQIYSILKNVKEGKSIINHRRLNFRRRVQKPAFITNVTANIEIMVSTNYIVEALGKFMKIFRQKRPIIAA